MEEYQTKSTPWPFSMLKKAPSPPPVLPALSYHTSIICKIKVEKEKLKFYFNYFLQWLWRLISIWDRNSLYFENYCLLDLLSISLYCTIFIGSWHHLSIKIKNLCPSLKLSGLQHKFIWKATNYEKSQSKKTNEQTYRNLN